MHSLHRLISIAEKDGRGSYTACVPRKAEGATSRKTGTLAKWRRIYIPGSAEAIASCSAAARLAAAGSTALG